MIKRNVEFSDSDFSMGIITDSSCSLKNVARSVCLRAIQDMKFKTLFNSEVDEYFKSIDNYLKFYRDEDFTKGKIAVMLCFKHYPIEEIKKIILMDVAS